MGEFALIIGIAAVLIAAGARHAIEVPDIDGCAVVSDAPPPIPRHHRLTVGENQLSKVP